MTDVLIVFQRDFRELRRTAAFRVLLIVSGLITLAAAVAISLILGRQTWLGEKAAAPLLDLIVGLVAYFITFIVLMSFVWAFGSLPVTKEKINGNLESLLATPLSPHSVWMGKCLAVFLPGFAISIASTLIVLLAVNLAVVLPATGGLALPPAVLITSFLVNPLLFFSLLSFIVLFCMANNPDIAITPSFIIGFGLMIAIPVGVGLGAFDITSRTFTLWYLAGAAIACSVVLYLSRMLTRENVVLSSKGE